MTVCVGIKVRDCMVFAADSASSLVETAEDGSSRVFNVWNHGIKVFNLYKTLPIMAMTAGLANFGPVSVSDLAKYLRQHLAVEETQFNPKDYDIEQVANLANDFFFEAYSKFISPPPAHPHSFEFWVGGYGSQNVLGEIWKIAFIDGQKEEVAQIVEGNDDHRLLWGGNLAAISRLIFGIDPDIHSKLIDFGVSGDDLRNIVQPAETPLVHSSMPVQDAINLADFLVHVSKKYSAFMPGANIVGGSTDIATVTRHEGFKWIKRKHYYPAHLNRRDTDHV